MHSSKVRGSYKSNKSHRTRVSVRQPSWKTSEVQNFNIEDYSQLSCRQPNKYFRTTEFNGVKHLPAARHSTSARITVKWYYDTASTIHIPLLFCLASSCRALALLRVLQRINTVREYFPKHFTLCRIPTFGHK